MFKKILIFSILSLFFMNNSFAATGNGGLNTMGNAITPDISTNVGPAPSNDGSSNALNSSFDTKVTPSNQGTNAGLNAVTPNSLKEDTSKLSAEGEKAKKEAYDNSPDSAGDVTSRGFTINVGDITPGMGPVGGTTKENVNFVLGTIIQNLMIALGSLALLIMTIGAGYILLHHGQDELLSKGKSIFMSGVYAMIIALSSYYLVSIVRYILYFGNN